MIFYDEEGSRNVFGIRDGYVILLAKEDLPILDRIMDVFLKSDDNRTDEEILMAQQIHSRIMELTGNAK